MWCIQVITPEYRERMYYLLNLYKIDYDPAHPVVCMDEKSMQLLQDSRQPIEARPGSLEKFDYEYKRMGTCNIFMAIEPKGGSRYTKVTPTRKKPDFANFVLDLVEKQFPQAEYIQLVMDNLNTHFEGSLLENFRPGKNRAIDEKATVHIYPQTWQLAKHGGNRNQHHESAMYRKKNSHTRKVNGRTRQMDIGKERAKTNYTVDVYTTENQSEAL